MRGFIWSGCSTGYQYGKTQSLDEQRLQCNPHKEVNEPNKTCNILQAWEEIPPHYLLPGCVISKSEAEVDGNAAERDETVEAVVRAANGGSRAARASSTDDGDGVASNTNGGDHVLKDDSKKAEEAFGGRVKVTRLLDAVAALDGPSGAVAGGHVSGSRDGDEGSGEEDRGLGEHVKR
jgi:hypothetical protein